ncbi:unnamed protein product, partial [Mesorhabditis belari]|uniref:Uncharacterized protein n=1 Tax=Mesorhabditis belari TaxID=2138241 RepID=A0AAF3FN90_9BILA
MSSNHPIYSLAESSTSWRVNNGVDSSFHPSCSSTYSPWNDQEIDTENRLPSTTRAGLSPPSKWPRASTPRRSLSTASFNYSSSSTFSLHSPPLVKSSLTVPMQSPLQRTPTNGEKASPSNLLVTPSPSRLRRNVRRSASAIARPLVLSNRSFDIGLREINFDTHSSMDNYEMWEKVDCEEENGEEELPIEIPRDDVMLSGGLAASQEK